MLKAVLVKLLLICTLGTPPAYCEEAAGFRIKDIYAQKIAEQTIQVVFELGDKCPPEIFVLEGDEPMVVCDFIDTIIATGKKYPIEYGGDILKRIRVGIHNKPVKKTRVVLDLVGDQNYSVDQIFYEKRNHYVLIIKAQ